MDMSAGWQNKTGVVESKAGLGEKNPKTMHPMAEKNSFIIYLLPTKLLHSPVSLFSSHIKPLATYLTENVAWPKYGID